MNIDRIVEKVQKIDYWINWMTQNHIPGVWKSITSKGFGTEFEKVTEYILGDDIRTINWNATAKSGGQIVLRNEFLDRKNITVFAIVDVSESMRFGTLRKSKKEIAAEISAILSYSAYRFGDEFGLFTWPNMKSLPPKCSEGFYLNVVEEIMGSSNEIYSLKDIMEFLPKKRCMVFLISDFMIEEDIRNTLETFCGIYDIVPILLEDKMEIELPEKFFFSTFRDLETKTEKDIVLTKKTIERFKEKVKFDRENIIKSFEELGIRYMRFLENYEPESITEFFIERKGAFL